MTNRPDPMEEAAARIRAAGDQLGSAWADAVKLAFQKAIASQFVKDFGPGPWILWPDGRVRRWPEEVEPGDAAQEIGDVQEDPPDDQ